MEKILKHLTNNLKRKVTKKKGKEFHKSKLTLHIIIFATNQAYIIFVLHSDRNQHTIIFATN